MACRRALMVATEGNARIVSTVAAGFPVSATVLGMKPFHFETTLEMTAEAPTETTAETTAESGGGGRLLFLSPNQIVAGAPVKLETVDHLWLGHVVECRPQGTGWRTVVRIAHSLTNLPELLKLAARFE